MSKLLDSKPTIEPSFEVIDFQSITICWFSPLIFILFVRVIVLAEGDCSSGVHMDTPTFFHIFIRNAPFISMTDTRSYIYIREFIRILPPLDNL